MDDALHLLLERWEDLVRDHPDTDAEDFVASFTADLDHETTYRFKVAVEKLNRMDQRLKRIGIGSRESG